MNNSNSFSFFLLALLAKGGARSKVAFIFGLTGYLAATTSATAFFCFSLFNIRDLESRHDKRKFVLRDQVFPLLVYSSSLLQKIIRSFTLFSWIRIVLDCFYQLIFCFD